MTIFHPENFIPNEHRDLVFQFFIIFMRFEYALKRAGFVKKRNEVVEADWDGFAAKYNSIFAASVPPELTQAFNYFEKNPPRKQILNGVGELDWSESQPRSQASLTWVLVAVRRVRNNLFHGGKFPIAPIEEPARNPLLLTHGLKIIDACLSLNEEVKRYFVTIDD